MRPIQEAYIVAVTRTPVGKAPRGMFRQVRPDDLLIHVLQSVLREAPEIEPAKIDDVIVGCAFPEAEQGLNVARNALLLAGIPNTVPGVTLNRFCSSGLNALQMAADRIRLGEADITIAAGVESMSMVPMGGNKVSFNPKVFKNQDGEDHTHEGSTHEGPAHEGPRHEGIAYGMGITGEEVAKRWGITREAQDEYAFNSHQKAIDAMDNGLFEAEITPYTEVLHLPNLKTREIEEKTVTLSHDEGPRRDTSLEKLAKLRPVFAAKGSVTAGNSSQTSDGAGAILVVSEEILKRYNLTPLARYVGFTVKGVPPEIMGIGPKFAIPAVLERCGKALDEMKWIELNEAFASQTLAVIQDVGLDPEVVNPHGGAIALGHPLGATGAIRVATLVHGMRGRDEKGYGMVTMCIGAGMGAAGILEIF